MANVMFKKGLLANLPSTYAEGTFYVTTDERAIYLDVSDEARIRLGDFQEFETLAALKANTNPSTTALYYIADVNCLAKWNGTDYIQINLDTGATSIEVIGEGNAVTAASYDPATRKITLTKGATFATPDEVDSKVDEKATELTAYVDEKTSGIATDESLSAVQERVGKTESDIVALQEQVGEGTVSEQINAKIVELKLAETYEPIGTGAAEAAKVQAKLDEEVIRAKAAEEANAEAASKAQADVDALAEKVGEVPADKTVVQMISEAQTAATYDDTQVKADIKANSDAIALLNDGSTVEGSVDYKIAQAVAAIMENPDETMNSINELVTWINGHAQDALELSNKVTANENAIADLEDLVGEEGVAKQITDAIAEALTIDGVDKYALATDLTAAIARIATLEGKAHTHTFNEEVLNGITAEKVSAWDASEQNAKDYADGLAVNYDAKGSSAQALADAKAYADGLAGNYDTAGSADTAEANAKAYADGLAENYDAAGSASTAESNAKAYADSLVTTWGAF